MDAHENVRTVRPRALALSGDTPAHTDPFGLISSNDRARLPDDVEDAYPLTELQARMLFHSELSPGSSVYHDALTFHLRVPYDPAAFGAALDDVMAAHPVLRTSFDMGGYSEPLQLVHRDGNPSLFIHDLRHVPRGEQDAVLAAWFDEERRNRFDWTRPPLFRLHVHRRTAHTLQATLFCHHAILDSRSVASFVTELFRSYVTRLGTRDVPAGAAPETTFREYVAFERASAQDDAARDYWTAHLAGSSPTVVPRWPVPDVEQNGAGSVSRTALLPPHVVTGLARAAARAGVPLKTLLVAVHLRVLGFVANERHVVTGVITDGRTGGVHADRVLGLFLNTLPLRCAVDGSWIDLARRVFDIECRHARHRHSPISALQRLTGARPVFDTVFSVRDFHVHQPLAGVEHPCVIDFRRETDTSVPLLTRCTVHGDEIEIRLDANRSYFANEQVQRHLEYYERAAAALAADPDAACTDAVLLSAAERDQLVTAWNAPSQSGFGGAGQSIPDLIAAQVQRTPDALAVVEGGRQLTYAQFADRARRLAALLQRLGVEPDTCVGSYLPRSLDMAVAVLATLQAGGAYVPFDSEYPDERLARMAEDSAVRVLLTTRELAPRCARLSTQVICLDDLDDVLRHEGQIKNAEPRTGTGTTRIDPSHLAYVMYASGPTGRPKGIGLPHQCVTSLIESELQTIRGGARALAVASLSCDASFVEMAAAWCSGGTVYLTPEATCAGSHAPARLPIANTQMYVLDRRMRPVPVGTPGELFIGGVSLPRGYYNQPDLTAARFVPDPIGTEPGGRLYRTGDLARWLPGGEIELLGWIDHQVTIRGHRIELSDVEAAIGRHPAVREAVVLAREYGPGDRHLVAYVIPSGVLAPTATELKAFVGWILPDFMVPAAFVMLETFPLAPDGRIDRRSLPASPAEVRPDLTRTFVAPRSPAERLLASIFAQVLRVDRVGIDDNFFERGGHPLLATRTIVRIREAFGLDVPLPSLIERPTVAGLAAALGDVLGSTTLDEIAGAVMEVEALSDAEVRAQLAGTTDCSPAVSRGPVQPHMY